MLDPQFVCLTSHLTLPEREVLDQLLYSHADSCVTVSGTILNSSLQTVHRAIVSGDGDDKPTLTRLWVVGASAVMDSIEYFKLEEKLTHEHLLKVKTK